MAWITVDQKLIGGKLRDFAKRSSISQNEAIGILIRLWLWGIDNADEGGRIVAGEEIDIEEAIRPGFSEEDRNKVPEIVQNLIDCGWIDRVDSTLYLHDWMDWRSYYTNFVNGKKKHAERMRNYRAGKNQGADQDPDFEDQGQPAEPKKKRNDYGTDFEAFWNAYPRKVDKGAAYKKYQTRIKDGYSEEELLTAATNYGNQCRTEKTEAKYIKHPKTFLSDTLPFTDYLNKPQQQQIKKPGNGENPFK